MHTFTRTITLNGSPRRIMPWAARITAYVNANSGLDVNCWTYNFGRPIGTLGWTTVVESQAALAAATAGLLADDGYMDLVEEVQDLATTPGEDQLRTLVYGTPVAPPPVGSIATVTTATALIDKMEAAIGWAVEIAQHIEGVTGEPLRVLTDEFGAMGGVTWVGFSADAAAVDATSGKMRADASYLGRVAAAANFFVPNSGHTVQLTKIA